MRWSFSGVGFFRVVPGSWIGLINFEVLTVFAEVFLHCLHNAISFYVLSNQTGRNGSLIPVFGEATAANNSGMSNYLFQVYFSSEPART